MKTLVIILMCAATTALVSQSPQLWHPVAGSDVNVRSGPSTSAPAVATVSYGVSVRILQKDPAVVRIGDLQGHWFLVELPYAKSTRGWIFEPFIAFPSRFVPLTAATPRSFRFCLGDYCPTIHVSVDGTVTQTWALCLGGACTTEERRKECASIKGKFVPRNAQFYGSDTCTTTSRLESYRGVFRFTGSFYIVLTSSGECVIPRSHHGCLEKIEPLK